MSTTLPPAVESIMLDYESRREHSGLHFTPPDEKARLGKYAFANDVITQIMVGITTGVLVHLAKELIGWIQLGTSTPKRAADIVADTLKCAHAIEDGILLLQQQGVRMDEARAAVELLKDSIADSVIAQSVQD